ncbi:MAG: Mpo1-like protein [Steroidobacteraceae bacterium]
MSTADKPGAPGYASFRDFYPFYLGEHANRTSRRLHVSGTLLALALLVSAPASGHLALLWAVPVAGYGFAWVGHYCFEKNTPATFTHPFYSLRGDLQMMFEVLTGRMRW